MQPLTTGYKPIASSGIIGNLRTTALVGLDGSIDWACLPFMDAASCFAAILDWQRGGRFLVALEGALRNSQHYIEQTNVLGTTMENADGRLSITDFMPLSGKLEGCDASQAEPQIHRLIRGEGGVAEVVVEWAPRPDYARAGVRFERGVDKTVVARATTGERLCLSGLDAIDAEIEEFATLFGLVLRARFELRRGQEVALVTSWGAEEARRRGDAEARKRNAKRDRGHERARKREGVNASAADARLRSVRRTAPCRTAAAVLAMARFVSAGDVRWGACGERGGVPATPQA